MDLKTCTKCGETKPLDGFSSDKRKTDGRQSACKECNNARMRTYYVANIEEINTKKRSYRVANKDRLSAEKREYRNTEEGYWVDRKADWRRQGIADVDTLDWEELIEAQGNKCFVCDKIIDVYTAHRDHDHVTGLTRAAVCGNKCNQVMDA